MMDVRWIVVRDAVRVSRNIGFSFCSKKYDAFENMDENRIAKLKNLRYYNAELHKASFVLPQFLKERLTK